MKIVLIKTFTLLFFLSCLNTISFTQEPPPNPFQIVKEAGQGGSGDDCFYVENLSVYVTNLDLYGIPEIGGIYTITDEVPPIYLQVLLNDIPTAFELVSEFEYVDEFEVDIVGNEQVQPLKLFKAEINFSNPCSAGAYNDIEARILTPVDPEIPSLPYPNMPAGYGYYPVIDYASPTELFSCEIFAFTSCACNNSCSTIIPSFTSTNQCDCNPPEDENPINEDDDENEGFNSQGNGEFLDNSNEISASPNPFKSTITLNYQTIAEEQLNISLFNISGQKVVNWQEKVYKGNNALSLSIQNIPVGIYFIQVINSQQNESFLKIVKE